MFNSVMLIPTLILPARHPSSRAAPTNTRPGTPTAHLSHQWLNAHNVGHRIFPSLAVTASLANGYLAWALRDAPASTVVGGSWTKFYAAAVVLTMGIAPWSAIIIEPLVNRLESHATRDDAVGAEKDVVRSEQDQARRAEDDEQVPAWIQKWSTLNLARAVFPLLGAVMSVYGALYV